jgi:hypothetical protein
MIQNGELRVSLPTENLLALSMKKNIQQKSKIYKIGMIVLLG